MLKNNIDREFDYPTTKAIVIKLLEKIVKEGALKKRSNIHDDIIFDYEGMMITPKMSTCLPRLFLVYV
jgi:hypothetical protein